MITGGRVRVNGEVATRAALLVGPDDDLVGAQDRYVSRAAHKLRGALADLDLRPAGRALDAGSSTGGFTQVLLEAGCSTVYAVDVGRDQLAPALRADPRVRVREQTNLRDLTLEHLDGRAVDLVVADVSFISLTLLVAPLAVATEPGGTWLLMVKPQFEVGRAALSSGGVVRSDTLRASAVLGVVGAAAAVGWYAHAVVPSRLAGPAGNQEYFVLFRAVPPTARPDLAAAVAG